MTQTLSPTPRLSKEEVSHLLNQHNLGRLEQLRSIANGLKSLTFSLITTTHSLILTLFHEQKNLPLMEDVTQFFVYQGFPLAPLLATGTLQGKHAIITPYLSGKGIPEWSTQEYETLGFTLGNLHKASLTYPESLSSHPFIWQLSQTFFDIQHKIPEEFQVLERLIYCFEEYWPHHLPKGIIHGDLWHTNILFENGEVSGILDFNPSFEPIILDLANVLKGIVDEECKQAFLSTYELIRPLSCDEQEYLPMLTDTKILSTTLYLLKNALVTPDLRDKFLGQARVNLFKITGIEV